MRLEFPGYDRRGFGINESGNATPELTEYCEPVGVNNESRYTKAPPSQPPPVPLLLTPPLPFLFLHPRLPLLISISHGFKASPDLNGRLHASTPSGV